MVVLLDPPYREYEIHPKKVNQLLETLVKKLPARLVRRGRVGPMTLDDRILPEFDAWDVRRYGGTQIAVREVRRRRSAVEPPATTTTPVEPTDDDG